MSKRKEAPGFMIFFNDFRPILSKTSVEETGLLFRALFHFFEVGEEPEPFDDRGLFIAYEMLKASIKRATDNWKETCDNKARGAKKRSERNDTGNEETYRTEETSTTSTDSTIATTSTVSTTATTSTTAGNTNSNANPNANSIFISNAGEDEKTKKAYGEYKNVLLSDDDLSALKTWYPDKWRDLIDALSTAMKAKGYDSDDHLAMLQNWAIRGGIHKAVTGVPAGEPIAKLPPELRPQYSSLDMMRDPENPGRLVPKPEAVERENARIAAEKERLKVKGEGNA